MRHIFKGMLSAVIMALAAAAGGAELLHYDFTGKTIQGRGKYFSMPKWQNGTPLIRMEKDGSRSLGLNKQVSFEIPGSADFDLSKGGTLLVEIRFPKPGIVDGKKTFDMIFFKNGSFLLGRSAGKLYFNAMMNGKWVARGDMPEIPAGRFIRIAVTFQPSAEGALVKEYIDGKCVRQLHLPKGNLDRTQNNLKIGTWGRIWDCGGDIRTLSVHDTVLEIK